MACANSAASKKRVCSIEIWHFYPPSLQIPILLRVVASIFDVAIVNRWNVAIGIPDQAAYIIGVDMVYEVKGEREREEKKEKKENDGAGRGRRER